MKLRLEQITEESLTHVFQITGGRLGELLVGSMPAEYRSPGGVKAEVTVYRATDDLFLAGSVRGSLEADCARCLGPVGLDADFGFQSILIPEPEEQEKATELGADDLSLGHYVGTELDLEPLCVEQLILQLPLRALCHDGCLGLCLSCGSNLNTETCRCTTGPVDPRLAVLQNLQVKSVASSGGESGPGQENVD